ncbi:MAG: LPS export ABC transporter ATP-binding protein [bacterium]|nr:LPS export ABC transporter ATP-binding protein [bacterium]
MSSKLKTSNLAKSYGKRKVVKNVSVEINEGEIVGLLGPNGAGKTTTFYMTLGLIKPEAGNIFLNDEDITNLPTYKRARKGINYLPQEPSVFRNLTVEDNIRAILEFNETSKTKIENRLDNLLKEFSLDHLRSNYGYALSGGERRRVEIARSLACNPSFVLLDEPFSGIDPIAVLDIQKLIYKLKEKGIGVLITDHNVRETLAITDRAYIIAAGEILVSGTAQELLCSEQARKIYLGESFKM